MTEFCDCSLIIFTELKNNVWFCVTCGRAIHCAFKHTVLDNSFHFSHIKHYSGLFVCEEHVDYAAFYAHQNEINPPYIEIKLRKGMERATAFGCGCTLTTEVMEDGEKQATLTACDNENCFIRQTVIKETRKLGHDVIYGRKDIEQ